MDSMEQPKSQRRRSSQRIGAHALRGPREPFAGFSILEETSGEGGVLLWKSFQSIVLWSASPPPEREAGMFLPGAMRQRLLELRSRRADLPIRRPLRRIARVLRLDRPAASGTVVEACQHLAAWADAHEKPATALAFLQAAALCQPGDPRMAYRVGRYARRLASYTQAEAWLKHALRQARARRDASEVALALVGLGNLYRQKGNIPRACTLHRRALAVAQRHGLRSLEAMAAHDLFVLAYENGQFDDVEAFAAVALSAYGRGHRRIPNLANDVACYWMRRGEFERALPIFVAILPHIALPHERLLTQGNIARAAGALGDRDLLAQMKAMILARATAPDEGVAQALLDLANGCATIGWRAEAMPILMRCVEIAEHRQEAEVLFGAEAMSAAISNEQAAWATPPHHTSTHRIENLGTDLIRSLEAAV
jgi:tetratricopeptide (TPR) repeat protein